MVSLVFEFFEEELDQWRRIARISKAKEDKELKFRESFERTCSKNSCMRKCRSTRRRRGFPARGEQEYREEIEEMRKRHSTELDAKDSLIISLRDHLRFLEGKAPRPRVRRL